MALRLRSKYKLILNPKHYLPKFRSTSSSSAPANASQLQFRPQSAVTAPDETDAAHPSLKHPSPADLYRRKVVGVSDDSKCRETGGGGEKGSSDEKTGKQREMEKGIEAEREGDDSCKYLRDFVEKSLSFDEEKVRSDGLAARKMMLAKMKSEWKNFLDGKSSRQKRKMLEDNMDKRGLTLEFGKGEEKEKGDESIAESSEIEKKAPSVRSFVDMGDVEEKGSRDWTVELGEVEEKTEGCERSAEVRKMEKEKRDRSVAALWGMDEKEDGDWTVELGDVEENAMGRERILEVTEMEQKEKRYGSFAKLGDIEEQMKMKKNKKKSKKKKKDWTVELGGVEEKEKGDMMSASERETEKKQRDRSVVELGKMDEKKNIDGGVAEMMRERKEKDDMGIPLAKLSTIEERERRNWRVCDCRDILPVLSEENLKEEKLTKSWDLLHKMKKAWNATSSFVFGNSYVQKLQILDTEKGTREGLRMEEKEIMSNPVDYTVFGSSNLNDTSQMLMTVKKILVGRMTESKAVPQKLMILEEERTKRDDFAKASETMGDVNVISETVAAKKHVISEYNKELQDRLQKLQADMNEEKRRIRLTCNEVLRDSFQKLHEAMLEEEKYIKSKCDGALRESVQKLQHNIRDEKKHIKSAYNKVLTDSLQELQNCSEEEMRRIRSAYFNR